MTRLATLLGLISLLLVESAAAQNPASTGVAVNPPIECFKRRNPTNPNIPEGRFAMNVPGLSYTVIVQPPVSPSGDNAHFSSNVTVSVDARDDIPLFGPSYRLHVFKGGTQSEMTNVYVTFDLKRYLGSMRYASCHFEYSCPEMGADNAECTVTSTPQVSPN